VRPLSDAQSVHVETMLGRNAEANDQLDLGTRHLLYGISWAFNIVVAKEGEPHPILVRALEPIEGLDLMSKRRAVPASSRLLTNGPGKLCQALAITGADYARDLCEDELYLLEGEAGPIARSTRINVDYAGVWAERPWRFAERGNRWLPVLFAEKPTVNRTP